MNGSLTHALDTTAAQTMLQKADLMCYSHEAADGGSFNCEIYDKGAGGTPVASYTAFDWTTPASWIRYAGYTTAWGASSAAFENIAEVAALVEWPAGLSSTGKPVKFRKFIHAVPATAGIGSSADIASGIQTSLATAANNAAICLYAGYGIALGTSGRLPGTPVVKPFYVTHQMPRGRRRKPLVTADGRYTGPTIRTTPIPVVAD